MNPVKHTRALAKKPAIREGSLVLIDQGTMSLVNFLVGLLLARAVNKEEFAIYVLAWSVLYFLLGIQRAAVSVPLTVYLPRLASDEQHAYVGSSSLLTALVATIVVALTLLLQTLVTIESPAVSGVMPILVLAVAPVLLREYARTLLLAKLKVKQSVVASLATSTLLLSGCIWLFVLDTLTTERAFFIITATQAIAAAWMIYSERINIAWDIKRLGSTIQRNWKMGKWLFINSLGYIGSAQAYPWIILFFLDAESVAIFGVISAFASLPSPFLRALNAYLLPRMSHDNTKKHGLVNLQRLLWLSMAVLIVPYGAWLILSFLFGNQLLTMLYSVAYSGNGLLIGLIVTAGMISGVTTPLTTMLQALERPDVGTLGIIVGALLAIVVGSIFVAYLGLIGIGIAAIMAGIGNAVVRAIGLRVVMRTAM